MTHVLIVHQVDDYPAWQRVFDEAAGLRAAAGERTYQVLRDNADPNTVVHFSSWTSAVAARAFFESPAVAALRDRAGVRAPHFTYLTEVAAGTLHDPQPLP